MNWLYVFIGGGIGSVLRYGISLYTIRNSTVNWAPLLGTFIANAAACLILAFLVKSQAEGHLSRPAFVLLGTGLCGGFSTFSTFSLETYYFWAKGEYLYSIANVAVSLTVGLLAMGILIKSWPNA